VGGGRLLLPAARQHHAGLWPCCHYHPSRQKQERAVACLGVSQHLDIGLDTYLAIALLLCTEVVELILHIDGGVDPGFPSSAAGTLRRLRTVLVCATASVMIFARLSFAWVICVRLHHHSLLQHSYLLILQESQSKYYTGLSYYMSKLFAWEDPSS